MIMLFTKCLGKDRKYLLTIACFCEQRPILYLANLHTSFLCNLIYPTFSRILLYSC